MMKFIVLATLASVVASSVLYEKPTSYSPSKHRQTNVKSSSPIPYSFKYEVQVDNYTSFGDTRISDEHGHVSGSYHVQLPDGRHQYVNYKDEGKGYVANVRYNDNSEYSSAPNVVKYKEKIDSGSSYKEQSRRKPKEQDRLMTLFYKETSSTTPATLYYKEPIYYTPATHSVPITKRSADINNHRHHVSTTTEFSAANVVFTYAPEEYGIWQFMDTIPDFLLPSTTTTTEKPVYITTASASRLVPIYNRIAPTSTTTRAPYYATSQAPTTKAYRVPYPATTLAYKKVIWTTAKLYKKPPNRPAPIKTAVSNVIVKKPAKIPAPPVHKNPPHPVPTTRRPSTATPVYKAPPSITKTYRIPVPSATLAHKKPVSPKLAQKKPINSAPIYRIPVSTTPVYRPKFSTTTPAYRTRYHTTKRSKVTPNKDISKKPYIIYRPTSNNVPVKAKDPYIIAHSQKANAYAAPPNVISNIPAYTVILYRPAKLTKHAASLRTKH